MNLQPFLQDAQTRITRFEKAFAGCDTLENIMAESLSQSLTGAASAAARAASATLFAKAFKSFNAVRILAAFGYGEDALIVTRALLNLSFVIGYICAKDGDSEERASAWMANGYLAQRRFIERDLGLLLPDHLVSGVDWEMVERYAPKQMGKAKNTQEELWPERVEALAKGAGMEELYSQAYRFMSSPEHSDAWGINTYMREWDETGLHLNMDPSDDRVHLSLEIAAQAMANVFVKFCDTFQIPYSVERIGSVGSYFHEEKEEPKEKD